MNYPFIDQNMLKKHIEQVEKQEKVEKDKLFATRRQLKDLRKYLEKNEGKMTIGAKS